MPEVITFGFIMFSLLKDPFKHTHGPFPPRRFWSRGLMLKRFVLKSWFQVSGSKHCWSAPRTHWSHGLSILAFLFVCLFVFGIITWATHIITPLKYVYLYRNCEDCYKTLAVITLGCYGTHFSHLLHTESFKMLK